MIVLLVLLAMAGQDDRSRATTLLAETADVLRKAPTLFFRVEASSSMDGGEKYSKVMKTFWVKKPHFIRLENDFGSERHLWVFDGQTFWYYEKTQNQYLKSPQSKELIAQFLTAGGELPLLKLYLEDDAGELVGSAAELKVTRETLDGVACDLLSWKRKMGWGPIVFRLWLDDRHLPRRFVREIEQKNGTRVESEDYREVTLAPSVAADLFVFELPKEAKNKRQVENEKDLEEALRTDEAKRAQRVLEEVQGAFKDRPAIAYESESRWVAPDLDPDRGKVRSKIWIKRPNLARIERREGERETLTVVDGKLRWLYDPDENGYWKSPVWGDPADLGRFLEDPFPQLFIEETRPSLLVGATKITLRKEKAGLIPCDVVGWSRRGSMGTQRYELWIDEDRHPRRLIEEIPMAGRISKGTTEYRAVDSSPGIAADAFSFAPPKGSRDLATIPVQEAARPVEAPPTAEESRKAKEILEAAGAALKDLPAIRYKVVWIRSDRSSSLRTEARVVARRPNQVRYEMTAKVEDDEGGKERIESALYVLDGKAFWTFYKEGSEEPAYQMSPQKAIQHDFCFDLALSMFLEKVPDKLSVATELRGGQGALEGKALDRVSWKTAYSTEAYCVWIDERRLIRRLEKTISGALVESLDYAEFDLTPGVKDAEFVFVPPKGVRREDSGAENGKSLLAAGSEAPGFEAKTLDGIPVRLSDFKGKTVLLHFWEFT